MWGNERNAEPSWLCVPIQATKPRSIGSNQPPIVPCLVADAQKLCGIRQKPGLPPICQTQRILSIKAARRQFGVKVVVWDAK